MTLLRCRAEKTRDVLIMLVHIAQAPTIHSLTTSKGFYDVRRIREALSERQRRYLLFCHASQVVITVSASWPATGENHSFGQVFYRGDIMNTMASSLDVRATKKR
ncbi:hypothetical protein GWK47_015702 [Chionoecetes opilio]|uniref:Uncharacterized protein n=1 Tax=Chionoecetes opilio TaxID=41210 RepID=A0A8J4XT42_CHIOP|nr:hypothetical protein GWK47_015702 [Chionoecetes opilio]